MLLFEQCLNKVVMKFSSLYFILTGVFFFCPLSTAKFTAVDFLTLQQQMPARMFAVPMAPTVEWTNGIHRSARLVPTHVQLSGSQFVAPMARLTEISANLLWILAVLAVTPLSLTKGNVSKV